MDNVSHCKIQFYTLEDKLYIRIVFDGKVVGNRVATSKEKETYYSIKRSNEGEQWKQQ